MKKISIIAFMLLLVASAHAVALAFPGAEGFGKYTTGGRGGKIYYVTSLDDTNTPGTLRYAINQPYTRTILFKVSGTITLLSQLNIIYGNLTIAGQSAPGDGICLRGYSTQVSADNVIIRYMRFRMGDENKVESDAFGGRCHSNIIIDHCSVSWSVDECCSFYENKNFTLQWSLVSESLRLSFHAKGPHGYGAIWGGWNASFLHNLMAHHDSRAPRFGTNPCTVGHDTVDYRNNVIYNWAGLGCYGAGGEHINMVNNYYKPGPATPVSTVRARICAIDRDMTSSAETDGNHAIYMVWGTYFVNGNYFDTSISSGLSYVNQTNSDNWTYGIYAQIKSSMYTDAATEKAAMKLNAPLPSANASTTTPALAYSRVLDYAGCSKSRDSVDIRIVKETRNGTAAFKGLSKYNGLGSVTYPAGTIIGKDTLTTATTIDWGSTAYPKAGLIDSQTDTKPSWAGSSWSAWPELKSDAAPSDSDGDGMPDSWETANGLDPNSDDGAAYSLNGEYSNLEVYLNSLVSDITLKQFNACSLSTVASSYGSCVPSSGMYVPGDSVAVVAVPQVGYKFVRWEDSSGNTISTQAHYVFAISADVCLKAVYTPASDYVLNFTVQPAGAGTITGAQAGSYVGGTRINARARYNPGYEFVNWTDASGVVIASSDSLTNYIVSQDIDLHAVFKTHATRIPATVDNLATKMDAALSGDTLMLAAGTYSNSISFRNGKLLTLMSAGAGRVLITGSVTSGSVSDSNCGLVFHGLVIQPTNNYFIDGSSFGNISQVAFHTDTIQRVGRCLIRGGNTTTQYLGKIEILNCIIQNCGTSGYALLYPKFVVSAVTVRNSTLIRYSGGENLFKPQIAAASNVFTFDFENNTVFRWSKATGYALCNTGANYSTASVYIFKNNIVAEPGVNGQVPKMLNTTGGYLTASNNLLVNYGGYTQSAAIESNITDLSSYSATDLYNASIGFQDTTAVANDFHILASSALARASTTGAVVGDPRWLRLTTAVAENSLIPVQVVCSDGKLVVSGLSGHSQIQVFAVDGKLIQMYRGTDSRVELRVNHAVCVLRIIQDGQVYVLRTVAVK